MDKLLVFAFAGNISASVLNKLDVPNKMFVYSSVRGIDKLLSHIHNNSYDYILGLGLYNHNSPKLRIEIISSNRFKNGIIKEKPESIILSNFLKETQLSKFTRGMRKSYCNYVSYRIMTEFIGIKYSFIHIPRKFGVEETTSEIEKMLYV